MITQKNIISALLDSNEPRGGVTRWPNRDTTRWGYCFFKNLTDGREVTFRELDGLAAIIENPHINLENDAENCCAYCSAVGAYLVFWVPLKVLDEWVSK